MCFGELAFAKKRGRFDQRMFFLTSTVQFLSNPYHSCWLDPIQSKRHHMPLSWGSWIYLGASCRCQNPCRVPARAAANPFPSSYHHFSVWWMWFGNSGRCCSSFLGYGYFQQCTWCWCNLQRQDTIGILWRFCPVVDEGEEGKDHMFFSQPTPVSASKH